MAQHLALPSDGGLRRSHGFCEAARAELAVAATDSAVTELSPTAAPRRGRCATWLTQTGVPWTRTAVNALTPCMRCGRGHAVRSGARRPRRAHSVDPALHRVPALAMRPSPCEDESPPVMCTRCAAERPAHFILARRGGGPGKRRDPKRTERIRGAPDCHRPSKGPNRHVLGAPNRRFRLRVQCRRQPTIEHTRPDTSLPKPP